MNTPDKNTPAKVDRVEKPEGELRKGWTTGACATAATKSALSALLTGAFEDPVSIALPKGQTPSFALFSELLGHDFARATIIKDAGDDPDVTHLAKITASVAKGAPGSGIIFKAGDGVGTVTMEGLPVGVGEPAINPTPRAMMIQVVNELAQAHNIAGDFEITISIENGEELAKHTWNPRLGIVGGLSVLGTTGIVNPFSCSAWIDSIHRGVDVSRAAGYKHLLAATGSTSEAAALELYDLPDAAIIDMGDFAGGLLKYLKNYPVPKLTIAGGFAKLTKLAQGAMDLHSGRSQIDFDWLGTQAGNLGAWPEMTTSIGEANTAMQVLTLCNDAGIDISRPVAEEARRAAEKILGNTHIDIEIIIVSREGEILIRHG